MSNEDQLEWEARWSRPAALAATAAAVLTVAGFALAVASVGGARSDRGLLLELASNKPQAILGTALNAIAVLALGGVLLYLAVATKHRRPQLPDVARVLAVLGPALYAVVLIVLRIFQLDVAQEFSDLPLGFRTEEIADDLLKNSTYADLQIVGLAPSLALGFPFVLISLNAMRAGLLSRFMGILGIIVGVLYVIPLLGGGPPIVNIFWLAALGILFIDRWPNGRGPAWDSGEAIPWPSAMEAAKAREAEEEGPEEAPEDQKPSAAKPRRKKRRR